MGADARGNQSHDFHVPLTQSYRRGSHGGEGRITDRSSTGKQSSDPYSNVIQTRAPKHERGCAHDSGGRKQDFRCGGRWNPHGDPCKAILQDLAIVTGGVSAAELGLKLDNVTAKDLGESGQMLIDGWAASQW